MTSSFVRPKPARSSPWPDLTLTGVTFLWGATFLTVQTALQWAGPSTFVGLRFGVAALSALALSWHALRGITRAELLTGVMVGTVLYGSYSLQTQGLGSIPSSKSAFLTALYVPLVPLWQWLLWRRVPRAMAWAGIAVAFVGLVLLAGPNGFDLHFGRGEWLTTAGAFFTALEICLLGRFAGRCHPGRVALVQLSTVCVLSLTTAWGMREALPHWHPGLIACVLVLGVATAGIQIAMNWAQKSVPATRATVIYAMEPVWAGLLGWIVGERMSVPALTGAALIVSSVLLSQLGDRR